MEFSLTLKKKISYSIGTLFFNKLSSFNSVLWWIKLNEFGEITCMDYQCKKKTKTKQQRMTKTSPSQMTCVCLCMRHVSRCLHKFMTSVLNAVNPVIKVFPHI